MKLKIFACLFTIMLILVTFSVSGIEISENKVEDIKPLEDPISSSSWDKKFDSGFVDYGKCIQQTIDGGYIALGTGYAFDYWLIKLDSNGNKEWSKTYNYIKHDRLYCVQQTDDGGYIAAGYREDMNNYLYADIWLFKTDDQGNKLWEKTFGSSTSWDEVRCVMQTSDEGFIITGPNHLIKTDSEGNEEWTRSFGGEWVQETLDGGYIITGYEKYLLKPWWGNLDLKLIKTNSQGKKEWKKTYGGIYNDIGYFVQQTSDKGYIIIGIRESYLLHPATERDMWIIKTREHPRSKNIQLNLQNVLNRLLSRLQGFNIFIS